jgi:hypothetical protein
VYLTGNQDFKYIKQDSVKSRKFETCTFLTFTTMTAVLNTIKLIPIFIACDDFQKKLNHYQLAHHYQQEPTCQRVTESEMMAIVIFYPGGEPHHSGMNRVAGAMFPLLLRMHYSENPSVTSQTLTATPDL